MTAAAADARNFSPSAGAGPEETVSMFSTLPVAQLQDMHAAGLEIEECYRVLRKVGANVVGEILKGQGTFYEWDHYPTGDIFDEETHSQYYYHAHRGETGEHGHFHTFLRAGAIPDDARPVPYDGPETWPSGDDALSHLVAIAMDKHGYPTHLFTTNRWVTGETFYPAAAVKRMVERFCIDHANPSWPTNRWLTAMLKLFRPQIGLLLDRRDAAIAAWKTEHPDGDVYEDRGLELTSVLPISVSRQRRRVQAALRKAKDAQQRGSLPTAARATADPATAPDA